MASMKIVWFLLATCVTVSFARWRLVPVRRSESYYPVFGRTNNNPFLEDSDEDLSGRDEIVSQHLLGKKRLEDSITCDKCPPGYGLVSLCNSTHRTVCQPCTLSISYSAKEPHFRPCTPCSKCGQDMYEDVACTTVSDTFCDACSTKKGVRNDDYMIKCKLDKLESNPFDDEWNEDDDDDVLTIDAQKSTGSDDENRLFPPVRNNKGSLTNIDDELDSVFSETDKEMDKVSKEENEVPEDLRRVFDQVDEELTEDDYKLIDLNITDFEKSIDNSVQSVDPFVEPTKDENAIDKSSDEDDVQLEGDWSWTRQNKPYAVDKIDDDDDDNDVFSSQSEKLKNKEMIYKPSEHGYPYEELLHPEYRYKQIRKVLWLYGITAVLLVSAFVFITCYAGSYYRRRRGYRFVAVQLTDHDSRIIRDCAQRLEQSEKVAVEKRRNPFLRHNSNEDGVTIHENPLEQYLDDSAFNGSTESLIPTVHKGSQKTDSDNIV